MSQAHKGSIIPAKNVLIPVDFSSAHFNFNHDTYGIVNGDIMNPTTEICTIRGNEGKFGGGVAVEEGTVNLCLNPHFAVNWIDVNIASTISNAIFPDGADVQIVGMKYSGTGDGLRVYEMPSHTAVPNSPYTLSFWIRCDTSNVSMYGSCFLQEAGGSWRAITNGYATSAIPTEWTRITLTGITPSDVLSMIRIILRPSSDISATVYYAYAQVENKSFSTSFLAAGITRAEGYLSYSASQILNINEGTISCWFKPTSGFFIGTWNAVVAHSSTAGENSTIQIARSGATNKIAVLIANQSSSPIGGNWQLIQSTTSIIADNWHMLTASWKKDTGEVKLYINGILESSTSGHLSSGFPSEIGTICIGSHPFFLGRTANGIIDDVRIDMSMASDEEVMAWYQSNSPFYNPFDYRAYS